MAAVDPRVQHDPDFRMKRIIDNGGTLGEDGHVYRHQIAADRDEVVRDDNDFPHC